MGGGIGGVGSGSKLSNLKLKLSIMAYIHSEGGGVVRPIWHSLSGHDYCGVLYR